MKEINQEHLKILQHVLKFSDDAMIYWQKHHLLSVALSFEEALAAMAVLQAEIDELKKVNAELLKQIYK